MEIVGLTIASSPHHGLSLGGRAEATITGCTISDNERYGIAMRGSSQATIEGNTTSDNEVGIVMLGSSQATIENNVIRDNKHYGVALWERPCFDTFSAFIGYVTGRENTGGENAYGDYCPADLAFLFTSRGGELDQREEE